MFFLPLLVSTIQHVYSCSFLFFLPLFVTDTLPVYSCPSCSFSQSLILRQRTVKTEFFLTVFKTSLCFSTTQLAISCHKKHGLRTVCVWANHLSKNSPFGNVLTVLCKSNESEFRRFLANFAKIVRKFAIFRTKRIFGEISTKCQAAIVLILSKFRSALRNLACNSVRNSFEGAKFQTKFCLGKPNFSLGERNLRQNFVWGSESSHEVC